MEKLQVLFDDTLQYEYDKFKQSTYVTLGNPVEELLEPNPSKLDRHVGKIVLGQEYHEIFWNPTEYFKQDLFTTIYEANDLEADRILGLIEQFRYCGNGISVEVVWRRLSILSSRLASDINTDFWLHLSLDNLSHTVCGDGKRGSLKQ